MLTGSPPGPDEAEISIFGPGYGECIVAHLGNGQWVINDSCINDEGNPVALEYLESLNVDPSTSVPLVVASHWHDDHIRGLAEVFRSASTARFVCSQALQTREFLQLLKTDDQESSKLGSGVREFRRILDMLSERPPGSRIEWAIADRTLLRLPGSASVTALAPSSGTITACLQDIRSILGDVRLYRTRVPAHDLNDLCVVLWIEFGHGSALLGGDLELHTDVERGWTPILDSTTRPDGRASVYKVAHHGSATARTERQWTELLEPGALAAIAPWMRGRGSLPTESDLVEISSWGSPILLTATPGERRQRGYGKVVRQELARSVLNIQIADPVLGHIRMRKMPDESSWRTETSLTQVQMPRQRSSA